MRSRFFRDGVSFAMLLVVGSRIAPVAAQSPVSSGTIITIAGNGTLGFAGDGGQATDASFNGPQATTVGPDGTLYIVDSQNYRIRAVDPTSGIISTIAGNGSPIVEDGPNGDGGPATSAQIGDALSLSVDRENNILYLPDFGWGRVRQVNLSTGIISTLRWQGHVRQRARLATMAMAARPLLPISLRLVGVDVGPDGDVFTTDALSTPPRGQLDRDHRSGVRHRASGFW